MTRETSRHLRFGYGLLAAMILTLALLAGVNAASEAASSGPSPSVSSQDVGQASTLLQDAVVLTYPVLDAEGKVRPTRRAGFLRSLAMVAGNLLLLPVNALSPRGSTGWMTFRLRRPGAPLPTLDDSLLNAADRAAEEPFDDILQARIPAEVVESLEDQVALLARRDLDAALAIARAAKSDDKSGNAQEHLLAGAFEGFATAADEALTAGRVPAALAMYAHGCERAATLKQDAAGAMVRAVWQAGLSQRTTNRAAATELAARGEALLQKRGPDTTHRLAAYARQLEWTALENPQQLLAVAHRIPSRLQMGAWVLAALGAGLEAPEAATTILAIPEREIPWPERRAWQRVRLIAANAAEYGKKRPGSVLPPAARGWLDRINFASGEAIESIQMFLAAAGAENPELGRALVAGEVGDRLLQGASDIMSYTRSDAEHEQVQLAVMGYEAEIARLGLPPTRTSTKRELALAAAAGILSGAKEPAQQRERLPVVLSRLKACASIAADHFPETLVALVVVEVARADPARLSEAVACLPYGLLRARTLHAAAFAVAETQGSSAGLLLAEQMPDSPPVSVHRHAVIRQLSLRLALADDPRGVDLFLGSWEKSRRPVDARAPGSAVEEQHARRDLHRLVHHVAARSGVSGVRSLIARLPSDPSLAACVLSWAAPVLAEKKREEAVQLLQEAKHLSRDPRATAALAAAAAGLDTTLGATTAGEMVDPGSRALARSLVGGRLLAKNREAALPLLAQAREDLPKIKDLRRRACVSFVLAQAWLGADWSNSWPEPEPTFWVLPK